MQGSRVDGGQQPFWAPDVAAARWRFDERHRNLYPWGDHPWVHLPRLEPRSEISSLVRFQSVFFLLQICPMSMCCISGAFRSPRAILSCVMIVYFESEVLPREESSTSRNREQGRSTKDPIAATLRNASSLTLASLRAIRASLGPVAAGKPGARKVHVLVSLLFCRLLC